MRQEDRYKEIFLNTSKFSTTEKGTIPLSVITVWRNMKN